MKFINVEHKDLKKDDALWREVDGAYRIWHSRHPLSAYRGIITVKGKVRSDFSQATIDPFIFVNPWSIGVFVIADLLHRLEPEPRHVAHDVVQSHIMQLLVIYGVNHAGAPTQVTIDADMVAYRMKHFGKPKVPSRPKADPEAYTDYWMTNDGTRLRVCDMTDRHLKNCVGFVALRLAERLSKTKMGLIGPEPSAVKEAVRRGLIVSLDAEVDKALDKASSNV